MKKTCHVCGFRNPAAAQNCVTCNAPLPQGAGLPADARCCPTPGCVEFAVQPPAIYCPLCGTGLKSVSYDLWEQKFVKPALAKDFVAALQGSSELLRSAVEMGLSPAEAEEHLDRAFTRSAGVTHGVLQKWLREHVMPLSESRGNTVAARSEARARAQELNIARLHAELILRTIASEPNAAPDAPAAETPTQHLAESTPPADPQQNRSAPTHTPDTEISGPAESVAETTIVPRRPRRVALANDQKTTASEPSGDGLRLPPVFLTRAETEANPPTPAGPTRSLTFRAALVCGVVVLCLGLALFVWLASKRAKTDVVHDRSEGNVVSNVSSAEANTEAGGQPVTDTTPAPDVVASPEGTPDADLTNSNTALPAEQTAVLILLTNADGVTVSINGRPQGTISSGRPVSLRLAPGAQSISATTQGYEQYQQRLTLEAGEKRTLFVTMRGLESPTPSAHELARQHLQLAQALVQRRNYQTAIEQINEGLRLDPSNQELLRLKQKTEAAIAVLSTPSSTPMPLQQPARRPEYQEPSVVPPPPTQRQQPVVPDQYEASRMTRKYEPVYPQMARTMRASGVVLVEVSLDERGRVVEARAVSGPKLLQHAAVDAAMRSGYSPARRNGQSVSSSLRVNFVFTLN